MAKRGSGGAGGGKVLNLAKSWGKARGTTKGESGFGDFVPVEPGRYLMQIVAAEAGTWSDERKMWLRWIVIGDNESAGLLCNEFHGFGNEDRDVWMQRLLINLGVEDDAMDSIETEDDLVQLFTEMIADYVVAQIKVVEKDGYLNMKGHKRMDVDEEDLVDPAEALKAALGDNAPEASSTSEPEEEEEEIAFEAGMRVTTPDGPGTIEDFDDDDDPIIKMDDGETNTYPLDDIEVLEEGEPAEEPEEEPADEELELEIGARAWVDEHGDEFEGIIGSLPAGGKKVFVEFDDGDKGTFSASEVHVVQAAETAEEEEEPDEPETTNELEEGDRVVVSLKGTDRAGDVVGLIGTEKVRVRTDFDEKNHIVKIEDVDFEVDE